jgi:uncharacterized protein YsxB (DUF464 family)
LLCVLWWSGMGRRKALHSLFGSMDDDAIICASVGLVFGQLVDWLIDLLRR